MGTPAHVCLAPEPISSPFCAASGRWCRRGGFLSRAAGAGPAEPVYVSGQSSLNQCVSLTSPLNRLEKGVRWTGQTGGPYDQDKTLHLTKQDHTVQSTESGPTPAGLKHRLRQSVEQRKPGSYQESQLPGGPPQGEGYQTPDSRAAQGFLPISFPPMGWV